jgi:outer membrane protein assembly factor BamB
VADGLIIFSHSKNPIMKGFLILFLALILHLPVFAQNLAKYVVAQNITAGKTPAGQPVGGIEYTLPCKIIHYSVDTQTNELLMVVKNLRSSNIPGYLVCFDLDTRQVRWTQNVFGTSVDFIFGADRVIQNASGKMICYDKHTGEKLWQNNGSMPFGDVSATTTTGANTSIFSAGGVFYMNLADSTRAHNYKLKRDNSGVALAAFAVANAAGITLGMLTGTFVFFIPYSSAILRTFSNVAAEGDRTYFASASHIYCVDTRAAKTVWMRELPKPPVNNSTIWVKGDTVLMMHNGYIISTTEGMLSKGTPFIAAFSKKNGTAYYTETFSSGKLIFSNALYGNRILAFGKQYLYAFNTKDGSLLKSARLKDIDIKKYKDLVAPDSTFIKTTSGDYQPIGTVYPNEYFVTDGKTIMRLSSSLEVIAPLETDLWQLYHKHSGYDFIRNNGRTILLKDKKLASELSISSADIYSNTLIDIGKTSFRILDVTDTFK